MLCRPVLLIKKPVAGLLVATLISTPLHAKKEKVSFIFMRAFGVVVSRTSIGLIVKDHRPFKVADAKQQSIVAGVEMRNFGFGLVVDECGVSEAGSGVIAHDPEVAFLGAGVVLAVDDGGLQLKVCGVGSGVEVVDGRGERSSCKQRCDD